jgi:hypothetical protein
VKHAALAVSFALGTIGGTVRGQEAAASDWHRQSLVGSARVAIDATYARLESESAPLQSIVFGNGAFAPFVSDHWQIGLAPTVQMVSVGSQKYFAGSATIIANFIPLANTVSLPYIGVAAMQAGATHTAGYGAYGAQAGWLRFLSPAVALRAEARYRRYVVGGTSSEYADVFLTLDPYLFGRARQPITYWPDLGVVDAVLVTQVEIRPAHVGFLNVTGAPFITRWLQVGGAANMSLYFDENLGEHYVELFGRGYLPLTQRVMPFAEAFLAKREDRDNDVLSSHGGRVGLRCYLTAGVALDLAHEWRNFPAALTLAGTMPSTEQRELQLSLRTQFRVARAPR